MFTNENFTEKLLNISRIILIFPSAKEKGKNHSRCFKLACSFYLVVTTSFFCYSSNVRFKDLYIANNSPAVVISILNQVSHIVSYLSTTLACLHLTFFNLDSYLQFFEDFRELSCFLHNSWNVSKDLFKFFLIFEGFVIVGSVYNLKASTHNHGLEVLKYFLLKEIEFFQWTINAFLMFSIILCIRNMFKEMNSKILVKMEHELKEKFSILQIGMMFDDDTLPTAENNLTNSVSTYNELCKLVEDFNDVFGFNILLIIINCIGELLFHSGLCAVYGLKPEKSSQALFFNDDLMLPRYQRIFVLLIVPVMLSYACECVLAEASKTIPISLIYLNELPLLSDDLKDIVLKEELTALFNQGSSRTPIFSAAGFFTVGYDMLGLIIGSTVSYIIVTLQFVGD